MLEENSPAVQQTNIGATLTPHPEVTRIPVQAADPEVPAVNIGAEAPPQLSGTYGNEYKPVNDPGEARVRADTEAPFHEKASVADVNSKYWAENATTEGKTEQERKYSTIQAQVHQEEAEDLRATANAVGDVAGAQYKQENNLEQAGAQQLSGNLSAVSAPPEMPVADKPKVPEQPQAPLEASHTPEEIAAAEQRGFDDALAKMREFLDLQNPSPV